MQLRRPVDLGAIWAESRSLGDDHGTGDSVLCTERLSKKTETGCFGEEREGNSISKARQEVGLVLARMHFEGLKQGQAATSFMPKH